MEIYLKLPHSAKKMETHTKSTQLLPPCSTRKSFPYLQVCYCIQTSNHQTLVHN